MRIGLALQASERRLDWTVYLSARPAAHDPMSFWRPDLIIEVIDRDSVWRDLYEKTAEYLARGATEYWIVDPPRDRMIVRQNIGGLWRDTIHTPAGKPVTTPLLPGFAFDLKRALNAAK